MKYGPIIILPLAAILLTSGLRQGIKKQPESLPLTDFKFEVAQVEEGIPGDVIAAIMAAIHAMGNGKYTLKAVRRSKNGWGNAGVNDTTAPF